MTSIGNSCIRTRYFFTKHIYTRVSRYGLPRVYLGYLWRAWSMCDRFQRTRNNCFRKFFFVFVFQFSTLNVKLYVCLFFLFRLFRSVHVEAEYAGPRPSLSGSVLRCPYGFWCFHFHWNATDKDGSEHRIMGKRYGKLLR